MSKPALPESEGAQAKEKYRVTNWPDYDRALVRRGDVTVWFDEDFLRHIGTVSRPENVGCR